jgi:hypothetical protein
MDLEFDDPKPRYRLCQLGFGLIALALALLSVDLVCVLAMTFAPMQGLKALLDNPAWTWLVSTPITWASLIGSYFLWGRWNEPSWQRRAGLLVLLNASDAVFWALNHAQELGLAEKAFPYSWIRAQITMGFGWVELLLIAGLATDVSLHLGKADASDGGRSARSLSLVGMGIWLFLFAVESTWLRMPFRFRLQMFLLHLGSLVLLTTASFQVTVLCAIASRQCKRFVAELNLREWDHDLLRSRSETERDDLPSSSAR